MQDDARLLASLHCVELRRPKNLDNRNVISVWSELHTR